MGEALRASRAAAGGCRYELRDEPAAQGEPGAPATHGGGVGGALHGGVRRRGAGDWDAQDVERGGAGRDPATSNEKGALMPKQPRMPNMQQMMPQVQKMQKDMERRRRS